MHVSVPAREKASFGIHVQCTSFLFRKLLGRCPHGPLHNSQTAGSRIRERPRWGNSFNFQPHPRVTGGVVKRPATLISSETFAKFNGQGFRKEPKSLAG